MFSVMAMRKRLVLLLFGNVKRAIGRSACTRPLQLMDGGARTVLYRRIGMQGKSTTRCQRCAEEGHLWQIAAICFELYVQSTNRYLSSCTRV